MPGTEQDTGTHIYAYALSLSLTTQDFALSSLDPIFKRKIVQDTPGAGHHTHWGRGGEGGGNTPRAHLSASPDSPGTDSQSWKGTTWIPLSPHTPGLFSPHRGDPHPQLSPEHLKAGPDFSCQATSVSIEKSSRSVAILTSGFYGNRAALASPPRHTHTHRKCYYTLLHPPGFSLESKTPSLFRRQHEKAF